MIPVKTMTALCTAWWVMGVVSGLCIAGEHWGAFTGNALAVLAMVAGNLYFGRRRNGS